MARVQWVHGSMGPWVHGWNSSRASLVQPERARQRPPAVSRLMALNLSLLKPAVLFVPLAVCLSVAPSESRQAGNDLDQFMAQVLARRDDNWRKLQQYVLEERETADFFGPGKIRLFGMDREYYVVHPRRRLRPQPREVRRRDAERGATAGRPSTSGSRQEKDRQKQDAAQAAAACRAARPRLDLRQPRARPSTPS